MTSIGTPVLWAAYVLAVLLLLVLDLAVFHKKAHVVGVREAATWSVVWILLSLSFGTWILVEFGTRRGLEFFTGYLIEYTLSVDNIFVFVLIFAHFGVPPRFQHRILFWGILGAILMRAGFVLAGTALIQAFHWSIYVFGAFLVITGIKILLRGNQQVEPEKNPVAGLFRRWLPMTSSYESGRFFVRDKGKLVATPLVLVLIAVETTDVVFAVDSIPAIFAVTRDPYLVFTSNICAVLGLRAMYFLLAIVVDRFVYLGPALGIVLAFVGVKMVISDIYHIPINVSLAVVACILAGAVALSLLKPRPRSGRGDSGAAIS